MTAHVGDAQERSNEDVLTEMLGEAERLPGVRDVAEVYRAIEPAVVNQIQTTNTVLRYSTGANG